MVGEGVCCRYEVYIVVFFVEVDFFCSEVSCMSI